MPDFIIDGLNNPIDISMKFSRGNKDDVIFGYIFSDFYGRWENVVRIKEVDYEEKKIKVSSKELGQFYVGLFKR